MDIEVGGFKVEFDLSKITIAEFRSTYDPSRPDEEADELVARCAGLSVEDVQGLSQVDWRRLMKAFFEKSRAPLDDPN